MNIPNIPNIPTSLLLTWAKGSAAQCAFIRSIQSYASKQGMNSAALVLQDKVGGGL